VFFFFLNIFYFNIIIEPSKTSTIPQA